MTDIGMTDIADPRLLYLKGPLLLLCGLVSAALLVALSPSIRTAAWLALAFSSPGRHGSFRIGLA
jgi:hypothetical protein